LRKNGFEYNEVQNFFVIVTDHIESRTNGTCVSTGGMQAGNLYDLFDELDIHSSAENASLTVPKFRQGLSCLNNIINILPGFHLNLRKESFDILLHNSTQYRRLWAATFVVDLRGLRVSCSGSRRDG